MAKSIPLKKVKMTEEEWLEIKEYVCKHRLWGLTTTYFKKSHVNFRLIVGAAKLIMETKDNKKVEVFHVLPYFLREDQLLKLIRNKKGNLVKFQIIDQLKNMKVFSI